MKVHAQKQCIRFEKENNKLSYRSCGHARIQTVEVKENKTRRELVCMHRIHWCVKPLKNRLVNLFLLSFSIKFNSSFASFSSEAKSK
jgi:hypothetical protein